MNMNIGALSEAGARQREIWREEFEMPPPAPAQAQPGQTPSQTASLLTLDMLCKDVSSEARRAGTTRGARNLLHARQNPPWPTQARPKTAQRSSRSARQPVRLPRPAPDYGAVASYND